MRAKLRASSIMTRRSKNTTGLFSPSASGLLFSYPPQYLCRRLLVIVAVIQILFTLVVVGSKSPPATTTTIKTIAESGEVCAESRSRNGVNNPTDNLDSESTLGLAVNDRTQEYESNDIDWCRRIPTWRMTSTKGSPNSLGLDKNDRGDKYGNSMDDAENDKIRDKCQVALNYRPNLEELTGKHPHCSEAYTFPHKEYGEDLLDEIDRLNSDSESNQKNAVPILKRPLLAKLRQCMDDKLNWEIEQRESPLLYLNITKSYRSESYGLPVMKVVNNAFTEEEAEAVIRLSECLREFVPDAFEHRNFNYTYEGGGNDVTYLAGWLQLLVPGVAIQIKRIAQFAWTEAGWHKDETIFNATWKDDNDDLEEGNELKPSDRWFPDPITECNIRTTEHLSYGEWDRLGYHADADSD